MEHGQGAGADVAGWFTDPAGRSHARWHDGTAWTVTIAVDGGAAPDPHGLDGVAPDAPRVEVGARPVTVAAEEPSPRRQRRDAKRAAREARRTYDRAVHAAERAQRDAERNRENELHVARTQLTAAEDPRGGRVGEYRKVVLYERVIVTPNGHEVSVRGATASVDATGSIAVTQRPTLTRAAAGGLLFGPIGVLGSLAARKREVHDGRELYLIIETEAGGIVVECPGGDGLVARQFAVAIGTMARNLDALDAQRAGMAEAARSTLARLEADTRAIDAARAEADRVRGDPVLLQAIASTETALAALEAGPEGTDGDDRGDSGPAPLP
jgi:hypothetical protein